MLRHGSTSEIRRNAVERAATDFNAGNPKIAYAGTECLFAQGIPPDSKKAVETLPQLHLPSGCTDPLALPAITFAEAYNHEILRLLASTKKR